jgi:CheY-like chemotaxis protein
MMVAVTAYSSQEARARGLASRIDHYLVKSADPSDVLALLAGAAAGV